MTDPGGMPPDPGAMPPPQPAAPPPVPASGAGAPGDLGTRFVARLIDGILLGVVMGIIAIPLFGGFANPYNVMTFRGYGGSLFLYSVITAAVSIGYFAFMESNQGQTVGKMAMSLRTEGPGGAKPTMAEAVKRNAWYALNIVPFLGGLLQLAAVIWIAVTINNSPSRIGAHDTFAGGTRVVKTK